MELEYNSSYIQAIKDIVNAFAVDKKLIESNASVWQDILNIKQLMSEAEHGMSYRVTSKDKRSSYEATVKGILIDNIKLRKELIKYVEKMQGTPLRNALVKLINGSLYNYEQLLDIEIKNYKTYIKAVKEVQKNNATKQPSYLNIPTPSAPLVHSTLSAKLSTQQIPPPPPIPSVQSTLPKSSLAKTGNHSVNTDRQEVIMQKQTVVEVTKNVIKTSMTKVEYESDDDEKSIRSRLQSEIASFNFNLLRNTKNVGRPVPEYKGKRISLEKRSIVKKNPQGFPALPYEKARMQSVLVKTPKIKKEGEAAASADGPLSLPIPKIRK